MGLMTSSLAAAPEKPNRTPRCPAWRSLPVAVTATAALVAITLTLRLYFRSALIAPVGFAGPIVVIALFRRRWLMWVAAMIFTAGVCVRIFAPGVFSSESALQKTRDCVLADFNLLLIAAVCDRWISSQQAAERHAEKLESANRDLIGHEEAIARQNEELQVKTQELEARRREAEENSIRKTHFLAAVSHDIRTPANAINLLAELIARTLAVPELSGDIPDLTRELKASTSTLVDLLNDVLDIARYDSGKIELQLGEFDIRELIEEQVQNLRRVAVAKELSLDVVARADGQLLITSDRLKLARVLGNLIGNAIKFTERGGVTVRAEDAGDAVRISVADTGIGIPSGLQSHIFEEFVQLRNPERDHNKGTGLGLSICRRLVIAMDGTLSVTSTPGQGSSFTVTLPKQLSAAASPAPSTGPAC
jgi:signal transduction histidine kinase